MEAFPVAAEVVCQEAVVVETEMLCCFENQVEPLHLKRERRSKGLTAFHTNVLPERGVPPTTVFEKAAKGLDMVANAWTCQHTDGQPGGQPQKPEKGNSALSDAMATPRCPQCWGGLSYSLLCFVLTRDTGLPPQALFPPVSHLIQIH